MRPAALDDSAIGVEDQALIDDVLAVAPDVSIDDQTARMELITRMDRFESLPFLPCVEIAEDIRQIPIMTAKYSRMED